jgi:hypothetical protein
MDAPECMGTCECTPGVIVDFGACECCNDAGVVEACEDGCEETCAGRDQACRLAKCPTGTGYCDGDDARCSPPDLDGDGYTGCFADPPEEVDCDDGALGAAVHPGAPEICDGADNDCDPATEDGASGDCGRLGHGATCTGGACLCGADTCRRDDDFCCVNGCLTAEEVAAQGCVGR